MRAIHSCRISLLRRRRSRYAYARACRTASFAGRNSSFLESRKPLARSRIALCRRCAGTPRLTRATGLCPQRPAHRLAVRLGNGLLGVVLALVLLRLLVQAMARPRVAAHQLAVARHTDALGEPFHRLLLRHWLLQAPWGLPGGSARGS